MNAEDTKKLVYGALAAGGGLGLLRVLADMVHDDRARAAAAKLEGDDVVAVTLPEKKEKKSALIEKNAVAAELLMAVAAGLGGYYIPTRIGDILRKKRLKKEIENAESAYLRKLQVQKDESDNLEKTSADEEPLRTGGVGPGTILADLPVDWLWLAALSSGIGAYTLLDHIYPEIKRKRRLKPKKVVVKGYGTVFSDGPGDGLAKTSSDGSFEFGLGPDDYDGAVEGLSMIVLGSPDVAEFSALPDVAGAVVDDREGVVKMAGEMDFVSLAELCKGASRSFLDAPSRIKRASVGFLSRNPLLKLAWAVSVVSEMAENFPTLAERVGRSSEAEGYVATKLASLYTKALRETEGAGAPDGDAEALDAFKASPTLETGDSETTDPEEKAEAGSAEDKAYKGGRGDIVDEFVGKAAPSISGRELIEL